MALSPEDLALNETELAVVKRIEEALDGALRNRYIPGISFLFSLENISGVSGSEISTRVLLKLVSLYLENGWDHSRMEDKECLYLYANEEDEDEPRNFELEDSARDFYPLV